MRRPDLAGHLQPLGRVGQIHAVQANVRHAGSVEAAVRGADIVINLVGILYERGRQRFDTVQAFGAEQVALAAANHGARMIQVSAIGADANSPSDYARAKAEGEKAVLAAKPDAVVFRPSIMFGPEDEFFNKFAAMARMLPALPLIGGGETKFQPVFVGDVAEAIAARGRRRRAKAGATYELGGPEVRTFKELMEYVLAVTGRRRLLIPLPFPLAKLQATFLQYLPKPLLTPDQVELLKADNVVSAEAEREGRTLAGLGIDPDRDGGDRAVLSLALPQDRAVQRPARRRRGSLLNRGGYFPERQRDQPERADDDAPPGEQREAVALHVAEERLHHDPGADERHREADRDQDRIARAHLAVGLVEIVGEGAGHGRHGEPERELGGRAPVGAEQHGADDGRARARHAGDHREALHEADHEIHRQREFCAS